MAAEMAASVAAKPTHFRALSCAGCARGLSCESVRPAYERESDRLWGRLYEAFGASRRRQAAHGTTSTSPSSKLIFTLSLLLLTAPTRPGYIWRFLHGARTRTPGAATAPSCSMPIPLKTTRGWNRRRTFVKAVAPWLMMSMVWPARRFMAVLLMVFWLLSAAFTAAREFVCSG